jgi:hypothetical protein
MIVIVSAGPFSSQKAVEQRTLKTLYFRPPNEVVLVYTPASGTIEVCTPDGAVRHRMACIFAEIALDQDVSHKPLTWKRYDLSRFRKSLNLPFPSDFADIVQKVCLTQVQITLGSWRQTLTLKVTPDDDIEEIARRALGSVRNLAYAGLIARLEFYVKVTPFRSAKQRVLAFTISGRSRCSLQSERDPVKRALGFRLLEEWGVLTRLRDLTGDERVQVLPTLLQIYDNPDREFSGAWLADQAVSTKQLEDSGYIVRLSPEEIVLYDDETLGLHEAVSVTSGHGGTSTLQPAEDVGGPKFPSSDLARFRPKFGYIREALEKTLSQLPRRGKTEELDEHLAYLGQIEVGGQSVPAYLARGLLDDRVVEKVDRRVRGQEVAARGIVFVPLHARFAFLGPHMVLPISELLSRDGGGIIEPLSSINGTSSPYLVLGMIL